jgi:hypothetical protein
MITSVVLAPSCPSLRSCYFRTAYSATLRPRIAHSATFISLLPSLTSTDITIFQCQQWLFFYLLLLCLPQPISRPSSEASFHAAVRSACCILLAGYFIIIIIIIIIIIYFN